MGEDECTRACREHQTSSRCHSRRLSKVSNDNFSGDYSGGLQMPPKAAKAQIRKAFQEMGASIRDMSSACSSGTTTLAPVMVLSVVRIIFVRWMELFGEV